MKSTTDELRIGISTSMIVPIIIFLSPLSDGFSWEFSSISTVVFEGVPVISTVTPIKETIKMVVSSPDKPFLKSMKLKRAVSNGVRLLIRLTNTNGKYLMLEKMHTIKINP